MMVKYHENLVFQHGLHSQWNSYTPFGFHLPTPPAPYARIPFQQHFVSAGASLKFQPLQLSIYPAIFCPS